MTARPETRPTEGFFPGDTEPGKTAMTIVEERLVFGEEPRHAGRLDAAKGLGQYIMTVLNREGANYL